MLYVKKGASIQGVCPYLIEVAKDIDLFLEAHGYKLVITSGTDHLNSHGGGDRTKTLHDDGLAIDIRSRDFDKKIILYLKTYINLKYPDVDVVIESNHWHIEYDPDIIKVD